MAYILHFHGNLREQLVANLVSSSWTEGEINYNLRLVVHTILHGDIANKKLLMNVFYVDEEVQKCPLIHLELVSKVIILRLEQHRYAFKHHQYSKKHHLYVLNRFT